MALYALPPFTIVLARLAVGAAGLWLLLALSRTALPARPGDWRDLAVMGLLNNALPFSLIVWGQQWIDGGLASVLNATPPVFGVVAAHFLTNDEKLTANRLAGVAVGVAGVAVLRWGRRLRTAPAAILPAVQLFWRRPSPMPRRASGGAGCGICRRWRPRRGRSAARR